MHIFFFDYSITIKKEVYDWIGLLVEVPLHVTQITYKGVKSETLWREYVSIRTTLIFSISENNIFPFKTRLVLRMN